MSLIQDFALKQNLNPRERAILAANPEVAAGWTVAASYARMISNAYGYTTGNLSESSYLGKADAFRHCLWSALLTYQVGPAFAKKLTDAHEREGKIANYNSRLDRDMDLHNNAEGRRLGEFHAAQRSVIAKSMTAFFLFGLCKNALNDGRLLVIDRKRKPWQLVRSDVRHVV
jgi:hypothetical protein